MYSLSDIQYILYNMYVQVDPTTTNNILYLIKKKKSEIYL